MAYTPSYIKRNYVNGQAPAISASNLNAIEEALYNAEQYLATLDPVAVERLVTTGTPIARLTVGGVPYTLYAPSGGSGSGTDVGWEQLQLSGTKIATITINDVPIDVYVPEVSAEWGAISGTLSDQTDLQNALNAKMDAQATSYNITASSWVANSDSSTNTDYPYIYTVTVSGMTATDVPICQLFGTGTVTTQAEMADIALVQEIVSGTDTLTLYATGLPTNNLVLQTIGK